MTLEELIQLKDQLIQDNPDLKQIMEQVGIDEEVYIQSMAEILGVYTYIPPATSNSTVISTK